MEKVTERGCPLLNLAQAHLKDAVQVDVVGKEDRPNGEDDMVISDEENAEVVEINDVTKPIGEADEGERIDHLVEEMRMEDMEH